MTAIAPYTIVMCRPRTQTVFDADGRADAGLLDANIDIYCDAIGRAAQVHDARLIAFPQFALTGYTPLGGAGWHDASLTFPGPQVERLAQAARAANAYVVVQVSEKHDAFPGRYFLSAAVLTPEGKVGMVYRKNYAMSLRTSPIDVQDRFVEVFGADAFFPVLKTPIGTIGLSIGAEVHWPEQVRALALKGAEIIVNPIAAAPLLDYLQRPGALSVRPVRAFENVAYLAMTNITGMGGPCPQVWDYNGAPVTQPGEEDIEFTPATIDIEALRVARCAPAANFMAQIQPSIHEAQGSIPAWPRMPFGDGPPADAQALLAAERAVWEQLVAQGRGAMPAPVAVG
ncbi:MAG TPA: nitrilase-related carbon-nitrogen hydrolase [Novosphingobium sp.]|nr:nitrilase-related carbon-nitrogen hydrolase [Novosphingobium sp.]